MKITIKRILGLFLVSVCFLILSFLSFQSRKENIKNYNYGVELYNNGQYAEAYDVFRKLPYGFKKNGEDVTSDTYCTICFDKILEVYYDYTAQG